MRWVINLKYSFFFWLVMVACAVLTVIVAEQLCVRREMREGLAVMSGSDSRGEEVGGGRGGDGQATAKGLRVVGWADSSNRMCVRIASRAPSTRSLILFTDVIRSEFGCAYLSWAGSFLLSLAARISKMVVLPQHTPPPPCLLARKSSSCTNKCQLRNDLISIFFGIEAFYDCPAYSEGGLSAYMRLILLTVVLA